jgi:4-amino-4-deoxy-L-arabinose transferase-like glycosyltransferase
MRVHLVRFLKLLLPALMVGAVVLLVVRTSIAHRELEDLDEAHHLMNGMFFADLMADRPFDRLTRYPFDYYRQYPALGFTAHPPFFPFIEGIFFRIFGLDLVAARLCMLAFTLLFAGCMYRYHSLDLGSLFALLSVSLILTTPVVAEHCNMIMLEIPTLATAFLAVLVYQRVVERGHWRGSAEVFLFSLIAAASIYTKQTIFFLFPAMLVGLGMSRRELLRNRQTWASVGLLIVLCIPLALFTLKYGGVNLAQSFGGRGDIFVAGHRGPSRLTVSGWTYYAWLIPLVISPVLCGLAVAALAYSVVRADFRRENGLLIGWILCWYALFSLFDNKQPRFVAFVAPAVILLAINFIASLTRSSILARCIGYGGILTILVSQFLSIATVKTVGFSGIDRIVSSSLADDSSGNIAYLGRYRQMFVPWVRVLDPARMVYVLQADDIASISPDFASACHDYQVRWVFVEDAIDSKEQSGEIRQELAGFPFELVRHDVFGPDGAGLGLARFRYCGPLAARMKTVPLRSAILGVSD